MNAFHQQLHVDTKKTIRSFLKIQALGSPHLRQDIQQITTLVLQRPMANKATLDLSLQLLESSDYRAQLHKITQPFMRLYGDNDSLVPKTVLDQIDQLAPLSETYRFKQASHAPFISHVNEFRNVLTTWLIAKAKSHFS